MHEQFYENERRLRTFALLHGITSIEVTFSGGGDSGQIDSVEAKVGNSEFDMSTPITVFGQPTKRFNQVTKQWEWLEGELEATQLQCFLSEHVDTALEDTQVDWYNNEGGQGHWEWNPSDGVSFLVEYNIVMAEVGHEESRPLGNEEEVSSMTAPIAQCTIKRIRS